MKQIMFTTILLLSMFGSAQAGLIPALACNPGDATTNGVQSSACFITNPINSSIASETSVVNSLFDPGYEFVAKTDFQGNSESVPGWNLVIDQSVGAFFTYDYELTGTAVTPVDVVLGIKHGLVFMTYEFTDVVITATGIFNSYVLNDEYSHVSTFVKPTSVPEPGSLMLLGLGLLGLVRVPSII